MRAFLVFVAVVGFGAVVGAVVVGLRVFEGTVVERPYEEGLTWGERQRERMESGLHVALEGKSFRTGGNLVVVRITRNGEPAAGEKAGLLLRRPGTGAFTERYDLDGRGDGTYATVAELPLPGRWEAVITVYQSGRPLEFPGVIHAAGAPEEKDAGTGAVSCDIDAGPCIATVADGGTVSFEITPRPVRTMKDLLFTLRFDARSDPAAEEVLLHLDMPGMYMGENRVRLRRAKEGVYSGAGIIVRCPSGRRIWRAAFGGEGPDGAAFSFQVDRP